MDDSKPLSSIMYIFLISGHRHGLFADSRCQQVRVLFCSVFVLFCCLLICFGRPLLVSSAQLCFHLLSSSALLCFHLLSSPVLFSLSPQTLLFCRFLACIELHIFFLFDFFFTFFFISPIILLLIVFFCSAMLPSPLLSCSLSPQTLLVCRFLACI